MAATTALTAAVVITVLGPDNTAALAGWAFWAAGHTLRGAARATGAVAGWAVAGVRWWYLAE